MAEAAVDSRADVAPERQIALDLFRRGVYAGPVLVALCGLLWGVDGLVSAGFALVVVLINFVAGAWLIDWAVKISPQMLMVAVLGGFVLRMGVLMVAVLAVRNSGWFDLTPFAITLIATHLGLLVWETKYVSATLAYPGLKPTRGVVSGTVPDKE